MVQRKGVENIERQKHQMVAALYSNPNWDDQDNDRPQRIKDLEENFNSAIELIYSDDDSGGEEEIDWDSPFWAAAKRAYELKGIKIDEAGLESIRENPEIVDQLEERRKAQKSIDQLN